MLLYFSKHLYIFKALVYFQNAYIFKALIFSKRLYFQSAYIFKALIFSMGLYFQSAFIFSWCFHFISVQSAFIYFLFVNQRLFIFSKCESVLFIFFFQEHYSALNFWMCSAQFLDHDLIIFYNFNMFQYQH